MKLVRFVFPFLFVRNWQNGIWEVSPARLIIFGGLFLLCFIGLLVAYVLHTPVEYVAHSV